jgi:hypothetical protein
VLTQTPGAISVEGLFNSNEFRKIVGSNQPFSMVQADIVGPKQSGARIPAQSCPGTMHQHGCMTDA